MHKQHTPFVRTMPQHTPHFAANMSSDSLAEDATLAGVAPQFTIVDAYL